MDAKTLPEVQNSIRKRSHLLLLALMNVAGIFTTLCVLLWLIMGEQSSITGLVSALMPAIFLPSCFFLVLSLVIRGWRSAALNLLPVLVFVAIYAVYLLPRSPVTMAGDEITFLTFNLHTDPEVKEAQATVIREANADVVALQELSEDTAKYFRQALKEVYPYQILYTDGMWVMGRGVMSRYPIENESLLTSKGREIVLRVEVTPEDGHNDFVVYSVHQSTPDWGGIITYNADDRSANNRDLMGMAAKETQPLVMLGDFNASDVSADIAMLTSEYGEACRERCQGLSLTFPATEKYPFPLTLLPSMIRLDYIFYDEHWQAVSAEVWHSSGGSDHRPMKAALRISSE